MSPTKDKNKPSHRHQNQKPAQEQKKKNNQPVKPVNTNQKVIQPAQPEVKKPSEVSEKQVETQKESSAKTGILGFLSGNNKQEKWLERERDLLAELKLSELGNTQLREQIQTLQAEQEISGQKSLEWQTQLALSQEQLKKTDVENAQLQSQLQTLQSELEQRNRSEQALQALLVEAQENIKQLESENKLLTENVEKLQTEREQIAQEKSASQAMLAETQNKLQTLQNEVLQLKQEHHRIEELRAEISSLKERHVRTLKHKDDDYRNLQKNNNLMRADLEKLRGDLDRVKNEKIELETILENEQREKLILDDELSALKNKLEGGNQTIMKQMYDIEQLENGRKEKEYQIAQKWAQDLGENILTKLSVLAEKEPEPIVGLRPRAVYESLLDLLEKAFGERPRMFPTTKEYTKASDGKHLIMLDADKDGIQALLKRYDWSPEQPFEAQQQCQFKLMHWGWRVKDTILVRARVTTHINATQD